MDEKKNSMNTQNDSLNFGIDIRRIFAKKLKSNLINFPNYNRLAKWMKRSTDNKNSQTMIKKYNYDLNNVIKSNDLSESVNIGISFKNDSLKEILSKTDIKNKTVKVYYRRPKSSKINKLFNSIDINQKSSKCFFKYKYNNDKIQLCKNMREKIKCLSSYKIKKNLKKNGMNYYKISNYNNIKRKDNYKNIKYKLINNCSSSEEIHINNNENNKNTKGTNEKIFLKNKILYFRNNNNISYKNNSINTKLGTNWKNYILGDIINNINKIEQNKDSKHLNSSEDNTFYYKKIRISTLLNLYNKNMSKNNNNNIKINSIYL